MTDKNNQAQTKPAKLLSRWLQFLGRGWMLILVVPLALVAIVLILGWTGFLD